ncbi:MAG: hypothetical protein JNL62_10310, partial [Bryobacterales bacterium]|nr:hypothetical protein [Bryobacterales bacterium]
MPAKHLYLAGTLTGVLTAAAAMYALSAREYTSEAVLRPRQIQEMELTPVLQSTLSRSALTNIILTRNLYPEERRREPMDDTIERMRLQIRLTQKPDAVVISFRHRDPMTAHRVTQELTSRFLDEFHRGEVNRTAIWIQVWKDQIESAAGAWEQATEAARKSSSPRAKFDAELARQRYADLKTKLADAEQQAILLHLQLGPHLE